MLPFPENRNRSFFESVGGREAHGPFHETELLNVEDTSVSAGDWGMSVCFHAFIHLLLFVTCAPGLL